MSSIWSTIHESGHARYEMGLNKDNPGLPSSQATSLGIHESQSRFWENNIGRSLAFSELLIPVLEEYFPDQMNELLLRCFSKKLIMWSLLLLEQSQMN